MSGEGGAACVSLFSEGPEAEPLDPAIDDPYVTSESATPLASQSFLGRLSGALMDSGGARPVTLADARDAYRDEIREPTDSPDMGKRLARARGHTKKLLQTDRFKVAEYGNPHTVMLSLRVDPVADGVRIPPVNLFEAIKDTWPTVWERLQYQLSGKRGLDYEYAVVVAGTDHWATPHLHIYLWVDGQVDTSAFRPAVSAFVESCDFAPDDGTGNDPDNGAVTIRGSGEQEFATDDVRQDMLEQRGAATTGAHYIVNQLPHISTPETATDTELLHGATVVAAPSNAVHFSSGCWSEGDGETPPEGAIDYSDTKSENSDFPNSPDTSGSLTAPKSPDTPSATTDTDAATSTEAESAPLTEGIEPPPATVNPYTSGQETHLRPVRQGKGPPLAAR